jgi:phosphoglycolate phosphatase
MQQAALLFDLDGTLVDSLPDLRAALNQTLRERGRRELSSAEVRNLIGDGTRALVERALRATGAASDISTSPREIFEKAHQRFLDFYEAAPTKLSRLYPGVVTTLEFLVESGAHLAICTNKQQAATLAVLDGFNIAKYFEVIVGGDLAPFRKPDPRHLLTALEQLNVSPNEAVMVGDNENDYAGARGAGIPVILMRYGYLRVQPESLSPDAWLSDFSEIPNRVANFFAIRKQQH